MFDAIDVNESRKFPMSVVASANSKILHDVLKSANQGKYYLTENGLKVFDEIIKEWESEKDE